MFHFTAHFLICIFLITFSHMAHTCSMQLTFHDNEHIYKITKHLGPHLGPLLGAAAATGMGVVGVGIVRSPMSPFPVPPLPFPPVGTQPIKQILHYPGHHDRVPKGYHYLPPIQHPAYNNLEYGYYGNMGYFGKVNKYKAMMADGGGGYSSMGLNDIGHDWWQ